MVGKAKAIIGQRSAYRRLRSSRLLASRLRIEHGEFLMAKAKADEAQLILQMYDLRRESVMRAARKYVVSEMWPQNYEEFKVIINGYGTEPNACFRQVMTYWNMAAAMVLRGAVSEQLFSDSNTEP